MEKNSDIPIGFCQCGCGQKTSFAKKTISRRGIKKGQPFRYCYQHNLRALKGSKNPSWKGGKINVHGYVKLYIPSHPRATTNGYVYEHLVIMEQLVRRHLNKGEQIHHIDGNKSNNHPDNLYLFCSVAAHSAYHQRLKAFEACGQWHWRQCHHCHKWDDIINLSRSGKFIYHHKKCESNYKKEYYANLNNEQKQIIHDRKKRWIANNLTRYKAYHKQYRENLKSKRKLSSFDDSSEIT